MSSVADITARFTDAQDALTAAYVAAGKAFADKTTTQDVRVNAMCNVNNAKARLVVVAEASQVFLAASQAAADAANIALNDARNIQEAAGSLADGIMDIRRNARGNPQNVVAAERMFRNAEDAYRAAVENVGHAICANSAAQGNLRSAGRIARMVENAVVISRFSTAFWDVSA